LAKVFPLPQPASAMALTPRIPIVVVRIPHQSSFSNRHHASGVTPWLRTLTQHLTRCLLDDTARCRITPLLLLESGGGPIERLPATLQPA
jgi:hypothetical protein